MFYKLAQRLLDIFFPLACIACRAPSVLVCPSCVATLLPEQALIRPQPSMHVSYLYACGPYNHRLLEQTIKTLKYQGVTFLAAYGGAWMAHTLKHHASALLMEHPTIIPLPLHVRKYRIRGFNQSELVARKLAVALDLPLDTALVRTKATPSQTRLTREERRANVANAFFYNGTKAPQHILLVDDVATTGATLEEAAYTLKQKGAQTVSACTLAYED